MPFVFFLLRFMKKLTVMGIIGHTQGVSNAMNPPKKLVMNIIHSERDCVSVGNDDVSTGFHSSFSSVSSLLVLMLLTVIGCINRGCVVL